MVSYPVTTIILIATVLVSLSGFNNREQQYKMMFSPYKVTTFKEYYRIFSHALVHADAFHLILNMYVLYGFGQHVETAFIVLYGKTGMYLYLLLYVGGVVFATLPAFYRHRNNDHYYSLGASGAVASVIFCFIMMAPDAGLYLMFIPIPIPAYIFGVGYLALEYYLDKRGQGRVAHDAHFFGAVFGIIFITILDYRYLTNFLSHF